MSESRAKGVGVRVLAEMAGHASIQTTQRYIDVNDEQSGRINMRMNRVNMIRYG